MTESMRDVVYWWENEIDSDKRDEIFNKNLGKGKSWSDIGENNEIGIKKRHAWLFRMYKKYGENNKNARR
jgi:hypothetical protein